MKYKKLIVVVCLLVAISIFFSTMTTSQGLSKVYTVKLYSASGQIIGTWESRELGRVDGQTLTFSVGNDLSPRSVRISGTFSIEQIN
ncbi:MAG: hypothetical protein PHP42_04330 [Bacteroidota bacterium]|nr:hypothetical protein [Bacteroidota bacterium]